MLASGKGPPVLLQTPARRWSTSGNRIVHPLGERTCWSWSSLMLVWVSLSRTTTQFIVAWPFTSDASHSDAESIASHSDAEGVRTPELRWCSFEDSQWSTFWLDCKFESCSSNVPLFNTSDNDDSDSILLFSWSRVPSHCERNWKSNSWEHWAVTASWSGIRFRLDGSKAL